MAYTETGITIDHELGKVWLDTTNRRIATRAQRVGFREVTKAGSDYRRFVGAPKQISLRVSGVRRRASSKPPQKRAS